MNHRRSTTWILICTLFAGIVIGTGALAIDGGQDDESSIFGKPYTEKLISVDFGGGTVAQYIIALERVAGPINIIVPVDAADIPLPAIGLNNATVSAAVELLNTRVQGDGYSFILQVEQIRRYDAREQPTYRMQLARHGGERRPQEETQVWSAAQLLATHFTSADVLAAIEAALDVSNLSTKAEIRFHEATGLIIVRGVEAQLSIIDDVLDQLTITQHYMRDEPISKLESQLDELRVTITDRDTELGAARDDAAMARHEAQVSKLQLEVLMVRLEESERLMQDKEVVIGELTAQLREVTGSSDG